MQPETAPQPNKLIIIDNKYCRFITGDIKLFNSVKTLLSFRAAGVEYTPAYKNGWSGITYLIDAKGYFLLGLLDYVKKFLERKDIEYIVQDNRKPIETAESIDIAQKLIDLKLVPRDHQVSILNAACANNKGIIRSCTGSGKTLATALITAKLNKPTNIYVIGLDLMKQFHDLFSSIFDEPIGFIGNGECSTGRINIISIWTLGRTLKLKNDNIVCNDEENESEELELEESQKEKVLKIVNNCKVHIFDESHIITTDTIKTILKNIDPEYIYGFSGTPFRDDNTDLLIKGILGEQIINISASELIEKKLLAQPIIKFLPVPPLSVSASQYFTIYKEYIVENPIRNRMIIDNTKMLISKNYTPLLLFKQIKHGSLLKEMLDNEGIKCEMLYGNDTLERRTEVKGMLYNKEIDVILASTIYDLGVDLPILNALVLCGGGKSSIRCLQRIGRVIRSFPGKQNAAIIDFYDQIKYLKKHSQLRYKVYSSEKGFKVIKCDKMK